MPTPLEFLRLEAIQRASSPAGMQELVARLLLAEAPEHPLSRALFVAIKAYVKRKRQIQRWRLGRLYCVPLGGTNAIEAYRHNVELLLEKIRDDMGPEATRALTHEMGEALNCRGPVACQ